MRLFSTVSTVAIVAAGVLPVSALHAQTANVTPSTVNILNLLSPFLALNSTTVGQTTLQQNLSTALSINNNATASQQQLAISDKNLLNAASNAVAGVGNVGVAANLAGGLSAQTPVTGTEGSITPIQPVGGLGAVLGPIYQRGVAPVVGGTPILASTVALLTGAYGFTSTDLGAAKFYFANGTTNGTTPDVAPAGYTLPTANGLPNGANSVYDIAYGVKNTDPNQDVFGSSRPVQVTPTGVNQFDSTSIAGLTTNPSFPSGHTTYAYTDSTLLAMLVPQDYQNMLLRASTYANSRIVLGVHYPLDIIASRALASYDLSQAFTNAAYMSNAATTGVAVNLPAAYNAAKPELQTYLATQCGASIATCSTSAANTAGDPYVPSAANQALYQSKLTYGLPTLTLAQAPHEAAPAGGPDASILLAPIYGGSTAAALAIAPAGTALDGTLSTATINQIIVNTETNALAAFYGTSLSYWTRIDLYTASGYFQNVIGTLSMASTDLLTTNVTVGATGILDANGTITGTTTVSSGGTLSGAGTTAGVTVASGGTLAPGSLAAQTALLSGATGVTGTGLAVTGPLAFATGSTLNIVASPTQATKVTDTGATTISGGTVAVQAPAGAAFAPSTRFSILTATGGVAGTFTTATSSLPFFSAALSYDANDVFVSVNRNAQALAAAAGTSNQRNVALALGNNAGAATGAGGTLTNAIFGLGSTQQARAAFDNLSGEGIVAVENAGIQAARVFSGAINDQNTSWLTGGLGAVNSITMGNGLPADALGYAQNEAMVSPIVVDRAPAPRSYHVWSIGFGGGVSISGNANVAGETGNFYGGVLGLDYQVQPNILVGIAAGGSESNFNVSQRSTSGDVTGFHGGVYSLVDFGPLYASNSVTVSSFSNNTTRNVAGFGGLATATEKASFGSLDIRTRAEFGRVLDYGNVYGFTNLKITPFVALEIAQLRTNGFAEYNANGVGNLVGLAGQGQSTADVPGFVGARFESAYAVGPGMVLRPMVSLAYLHEFAPQRNLQNGFVSLPGSTFLVSGARPSSNAAQTKAGFELDMGHGVGLFANFDGEFSDLERVYGGKGGVRVTW